MPKRRNVQIVTGSPHPSRMMSPAKRVKARKGRAALRPEPMPDSAYWQERAEDAWHQTNSNERYAADQGMPLADFECRHGALPTDTKIDCDCWGKPTEQLPQDLLEEASRHGNEREVRTQ